MLFIMDIAQINKELELFSLKIKLLSILKCYLNNTSQAEIQFFYKILDLLQIKYNDTDDVNFIEEGIKNHLQTYRNNLPRSITDISSHIYNYNNESLLRDLLNSINTKIYNKIVELQEEIPNIL